MKFRDKSSKLYAFALAGVFALVLAGCGGGGGTAAMDTVMCTAPQVMMDGACVDPPPTAEERIVTAQGNADTAATNARADADAAAMLAHQGDAAVAAAVASAEAAAMAAKAAADAAANATDPAAAEALAAQAQAEAGNAATARSHAMTASGLAETAAEAKAAAAAVTKSAGTKVKAIAAEATSDGMAGVGGRNDDETPLPITTTMYTIERDRDGITVKVTDENMNGDDDPKFSEAVGFANGSMQVRTMKENDDGETESEVVVVRTDIAAPTARPFAKDDDNKGVYTLDVDLAPNMDANNDGEPDNDFTAKSVGINASTPPDQAELKLVKSSAFVPGAGSETDLTFNHFIADNDDDTAGNQPRAAYETAGTYNGADGTYKCNLTGESCTVKLNAKGEISEMSAGWVFIPGDNETVDVADATYLSYGFWLKRTMSAKDGTVYNEVETFAMAHGINESTTDGIGDVRGDATYEGGAAGVYVKNVTDNQGATLSSTSGQFEADVELNANFGGGNIGVNNQFVISGEVKNFTLHPTDDGGNSNAADNDWAVKLNATDFSGRTGMGPGKEAAGSQFENTFSGTATGDSSAAAGSWSGAFFGTAGQVDHDSNGSTPAINTAPSAVTGEFNANFTDGTAAGGFGVNIKK